MAPGVALLLSLGGIGSPLTLSASVGPGARNHPSDLRGVILKLSVAGFLTLPTSGQATAAAIKRFQKDRVGFNKPDGRVDPGGKTLAALNTPIPTASGAPPASATVGGKTTPPATTGPGSAAGGSAAPMSGTGGALPAPTSGPTPQLLLISPVGSRAPNHPMDVALVRDRLQGMGIAPGTTQEELVTAIKRFQSRAFNKKERDCDGRVDVGGATHHALSAGVRPGLGQSVPDLDAVVAGLDHPEVASLRAQIAELTATEATIAEDKNEEQGSARDDLVVRIGQLRREVNTLQLAGLEAAESSAVRAWAHRKLNALSPYYSQGRNVNFLEGDATRTCNITALAMALEALGRSTTDYKGDAATLQFIRRFEGTGGKYKYRKAFDKGDDRGSDDVFGLRLPDFLQLAMVARNMSKGMALLPAVKQAWDDILFMERMRDVAVLFGVGAWIRSGLGGSGKTLRARYDEALGGVLDSGHQVLMLTPGHYVRLEAITDKGLIVDDPGRHAKKNLLKPWKDASGYAIKMMILA